MILMVRQWSLMAKMGAFGVGVALLLWLSMASLILVLPADSGAPVLTGGDLLLGTLVAAVLFGGVGALFGYLGDHSGPS